MLPAKLRYADKSDWSRAAVDATIIRALRGDKTGKTPTDRVKRATRDHLLADCNCVPLAMHATAANRHESTQLLVLANTVSSGTDKPGNPRRKPEAITIAVFLTANRRVRHCGRAALSRL